MRIIPKNTKIKNTFWKSYSLKDILIILGLFMIVFFLLIKGKFILSIVTAIISLLMFIPTPDGIFYNFVVDYLKYLFGKKEYVKEEMDKLVSFKEVDLSGVIKFNDGSFGKVIKLGQKNFGIEDLNEQDVDINYFANAIKCIDISQMIDLVKIDRPVNFDEFSFDLFEKIQFNKQGKVEQIDKIKSNILKERIDKIDNLNNFFKQYVSDFYLVVYSKKAKEIDMLVNLVVSEINKCGLDTNILNKKEVIVFLKYNNSHIFDERVVNTLDEDELINWAKPKKIKFSSNRCYIDDVESVIYSVNDYPLKVKNAWGNNIFNIPNTKVVLRIKPVDKFKAIKRVDGCITELETKEVLSEKYSETKEASLHKETMLNLLNSLQSENEALYDVNMSITAYNYLKDSNYRKRVRNVILKDNFRTSPLYAKQKDGFIFSSLGYNNLLTKYERGINSSSLAAVFPFIRTIILDKQGILLGKNKNNDYPFIFNLWKRGNLYHNSNAMIIGKSGSGKSYFLKILITNEWSNDTRIIICDPEAEYINLTKNLKGNVIDVGNALEGRINPFHIYQILTEDGKCADSSVTFNTHLKMLESFFRIVLEDVSSSVIELINNLVIVAYKTKNIDSNTKFHKLKPKDYPLFSDLLNVLDLDEVKAFAKEDDLQLARLYLQKFVNGRYSDIWNHPSTLEVNAQIINFNFQALFANKNNVIANAQMLLIFRFIEQEIINAKELSNNGKELKTMIVCDEAHLFIDPKYPIALDFFYQMNKRIRKYNGSFIPATQNISDWNGNEELKHKTSTILKNSQYLFIFKLSAPDMKDVIDVYRTGEGFNEEEQRIIVSATTGDAFFVGSTELRASIKVLAGEYTKQLFTERND
ncbi:MAG: VirB4 family type IV secretion system protein [Bacilli bacterium]|nr:VirB4 family type IV secretion system protein [Bacilli bacterium]MBQ8472086.1 VirB4 family type IV secretion system protein [Bacilli bacterium]